MSDQQTKSAGSRKIIINRVQLTDAQVTELETLLRNRIADGSYWYDNACGAAGIEGGPALTLLKPGLSLGGPMQPDCSAGDTGVFINGRHLHRLDVARLMLLGPVLPGRYWVDATGNLGVEGWPAMLNLYAIAQQRAVSGGGGGPWTMYTSAGMFSNDGQGKLMFNMPGGMTEIG